MGVGTLEYSDRSNAARSDDVPFRRTAAFLMDALMLNGAIALLSIPISHLLDAWLRRSGAEMLYTSAGGPSHTAGELAQAISTPIAVLLLLVATLLLRASPGKRLVRLQVSDRSGSAPTSRQLAVRTLVKWSFVLISGLGMGVAGLAETFDLLDPRTVFWVALPAMLVGGLLYLSLLLVFTGDRRGLHDYAAGTIVRRR